MIAALLAHHTKHKNSAATMRSQRGSIQMKILVIDDDKLIRESIQDILHGAGYDVILATGAQEGLACAFSDSPDLILCDVKMPGITGFDVVKTLRADQRTCAVPIILMTGYAEDFTIREAMDLGGDDFITKPYTSQTIVNAVKARLSRIKSYEKKAEEKIGHFIDRISIVIPHELRTPLASIIGYSDYLLRYHDAIPKEEMLEVLRVMFLAGKDLHDTIEKFILYSRLQAYGSDPAKVKELRQKRTMVQPVVNDLINKATYLWERIEDVHLSVEDLVIAIDDHYLSRMIDNLLNNAAKFSPTGTRITLNVVKEDTYAAISVSNFGRGMTETQIQAISVGKQFERERFEQQGLGFGLANVLGIVRLFGGKMSIQSTQGEETIVTVHLPLAK